MQAENLLLNCILSNQVIYSHFLFLANAVCPVSGLLFYGWIPPWVKVNHIIRTGQIKSKPSRFERNKENRLMPILEFFNHFGAIPQWSRTVQIEIIIDSGCLHFSYCHIQEGCELTEHQYPVALLDYLRQLIKQHIKFA